LLFSYLYSLAIKNADENAPTKRDLVNAEFLDGEQWVYANKKLRKKEELTFIVLYRPTLEEIRSWGKSFDKLMKSSCESLKIGFLICTNILINVYSQLVVRCSRTSCAANSARRTSCSGWPARTSRRRAARSWWRRRRASSTRTTSRSCRPERCRWTRGSARSSTATWSSPRRTPSTKLKSRSTHWCTETHIRGGYRWGETWDGTRSYHVIYRKKVGVKIRRK